MPETPGRASKISEPGPYTFTREQLVHVLQMPPVTGTLAMIEEQGGGPEDLADAILESLDELTGGAGARTGRSCPSPARSAAAGCGNSHMED